MKYAYVCPLILAYSPLVYFASAHVTLRQASSPPGFHRPQGTRNPLLTGDCALAQYTLIDDGPTWYYVPFVGCISGRPGCCPFTPAPQGQIAATAGSSRAVYPQPRDAKDATLRTCPADYYFISGSCCPSSFTPWTAVLGGETPCVSTLTASTTPPPVTDRVEAEAGAEPTVTITGTVFARQYAFSGPSRALSPGAIAGVTIAGTVAAATVFGLGLLIRRHRRSARNLARLKAELFDGFHGTGAGTSEVPTARRAHRAGDPTGPEKEHRPEHRTEPPMPDYSTASRRSRDRELRAQKRMGRVLDPRLPQSYFYTLPAAPPARHAAEMPGARGEVRLARAERLTRGYPRVVRTHGRSSPASGAAAQQQLRQGQQQWQRQRVGRRPGGFGRSPAACSAPSGEEDRWQAGPVGALREGDGEPF